MEDNQIRNKPTCQTEGCTNEAIGVLNHKWRCGECFIRFEEKIREAREKLFIKEDVQ